MMTEQAGPEFSREERLEQAAGNWWALYAATVDYLREQGHSPEAFVDWFGERVAPGWEGVRGNLEQIAYYAALNPVSLGGELRGYDVGEDEATVRIQFPPSATEMASEEDVDMLSENYRPIMDYLDVDYEWEREGDVITFHLRRRPGA